MSALDSHPDNVQIPAEPDLSVFHSELCSKWQRLMDSTADEPGANSPFRYRLHSAQPRKSIAGPLAFVAQLNSDRVAKRRPALQMNSVSERVDPAGFHFGRVRTEEVLAELTFERTPIAFLVNNSPLTRFHMLVCPDREALLPQRLTYAALRFAVELLKAIADRRFRIGYNSPGAWASVNNLHLHLLFIEQTLLLERLQTQPVDGTPICRLIGRKAVDGFAFDVEDALQGAVLAERCAQIVRFVERLVAEQIPHNVLLQCMDGGAVRVFVFPKAAFSTGKGRAGVIPIAICELSGFVSLGDPELYESITEDFLVQQMRAEVGDVCERISDSDLRELYSR